MSSPNGSVNGLLREGDVLASGYEVISHLSRGRALDVYDAWSIERDCRCVAKVARPDRRTTRVRRRLIREGELLVELAHPHIVRAYELRHRPRTVLILETIGGETVEHMAESAARRMASADVAHLGVHLCSAIGYLHGHGYLHLDLKPSNVIVQGGQARVIDLSLSRRPGPVPRGLGSPRTSRPNRPAEGGPHRLRMSGGSAPRSMRRLRGSGRSPVRDRSSIRSGSGGRRRCAKAGVHLLGSWPWSMPASRLNRRTGRRLPRSRMGSTLSSVPDGSARSFLFRRQPVLAHADVHRKRRIQIERAAHGLLDELRCGVHLIGRALEEELVVDLEDEAGLEV